MSPQPTTPNLHLEQPAGRAGRADSPQRVPQGGVGGAAGAHPLRVVFCPDSFKGTLDAASVAEAMRRGWVAARPGDADTCELVPMADGGEGTRRAFQHARPEATVVELAELCGIERFSTLDPWGAGTRPLGERLREELLRVAATTRDRDEHRGMRPVVYLGIGSSASTDCGAGMLQGLGVSITDAAGAPIAPGLAGVATARGVDFRSAADVLEALARVDLQVITDVRAPLVGPQGAAQAFGPQKGLAAADMNAADEAVLRFARLLQETAPVHAEVTAPGAGAAGGVGFACLSLGAELLPGAAHMATALCLAEKIRRADYVVTGEGAFDATSLQGKVPAAVLELCTAAATPCALVAGIIREDAPTAAFAAAESVSLRAGSAHAAQQDPARWVADTTRALAGRL
ncbi:glycerate kinase [Corynebacterium sp. 13CS0277]|uniref:glycerate kinase n=1 Tax=Corynebacterium sp. 13CS0277 TaxID=2071994 RepID=UPI000D03593B|nr:glycerate kinase [Corynebacterium sp. 13CS0277]PRQ12263.1 glycerate kinase [Corynebacterium sp. 13CS0277]